MSVQQIKAKFRAFIDEHQPMDPYELRRIFSEAIREWEIERGWDETQILQPELFLQRKKTDVQHSLGHCICEEAFYRRSDKIVFLNQFKVGRI